MTKFVTFREAEKFATLKINSLDSTTLGPAIIGMFLLLKTIFSVTLIFINLSKDKENILWKKQQKNFRSNYPNLGNSSLKVLNVIKEAQKNQTIKKKQDN